MSVKVTNFGKTLENVDIRLFTIENKNGMKVSVCEFGAVLTHLYIKGKDGKERDIVLGFDDVSGYERNSSFFGATVGPIANRTADARYTIDGTTYRLDGNDGANNLHTDFYRGFHKRLWNAEYDDNSVKFTIEKKDMDLGIPGNMKVSVTYSLSDDNEISIHYNGVSDKKSVFNMTNHSYFNLNGHDSGKIEDEVLWLKASHYTPVVLGAIPTGEIAPVKGTVMDFTSPTRVGERIAADEEQLLLVRGYDHNFVVDGWDKTRQLIAYVTDDKSGVKMEVFSDLPGVQFYAGNCIGWEVGKGNTEYGPRLALCLETQYYPNSLNQEGFPCPVFDAMQEYDTTTSYKFSLL